MSSIPEKSTIVERRVSNLLRSSSFQKLKCSATYPFQLAGTKLSKDAVKQLFETLVIKARVLLQKALLVLSIALFRIYGAVLSSVWVDTSAKCISGDGVSDKSATTKAKTTLTFSQRILQKIQKLKEHKRKFEKRVTEVLSSCKSTTEVVADKDRNNNNNCLLSNNIPKQLNDSTIKFQDEIAALRKYATESISKPKQQQQQQNKVNENQKEETILKSKNTKQNICFAFFVYISFIFTYLQLLILTLALNTTIIPPGLVFLISSLLLVTFIVFKIFFMDKTKKESLKQQSDQHSKTSTRRTTNQSSSTTTTTPSCLIKSHSCLNMNERESRSRLRPRPVIDLNNKTLSKIKLL